MVFLVTNEMLGITVVYSFIYHSLTPGYLWTNFTYVRIRFLIRVVKLKMVPSGDY